MRIASLEDDPIESKLIHQVVTDAGHACTVFHTGSALLETLRMRADAFDMLILDWHLPDMTGKDVIEWVRRNLGDQIVVMFLTNRVLEENIVSGLMAGADDYMTKPIREGELSARLHALSKRIRPAAISASSASASHGTIEAGVYTFDLFNKIATVRDMTVELKPKEFDIAALFFQNIGQLISRERIMETVWGRELVMTSRTLDTHMSQVRTKLQLKPDNNVRLTTVYTIGYRLDMF
ncbi:response regulator transcription factor [Oxalicibacterium faecigallinarum]|uniref:DNA-binding response regulator n=1 Tax=Oxalicibacterium faecigallinarum TaxID=573741 RepID=A0A8J3F3V5_9BURK|nr:response regulator transcription factor [Oxalicibacterium faecigallinarum]GGI16056.1 DNA-binding response regulator [Oxalicibacterium faecigallinarum]